MDILWNALLSNAVLASLLAVVVFGVTRLWRNQFAARTLWLIVLLKLLTPPIVYISSPIPSTAETVVGGNDRLSEPPDFNEPFDAEALSDEPRVPEPRATHKPADHDPRTTAPVADSSSGFRVSIATALCGVWFVGSLILIIFGVYRCVVFQRLLDRHAKSDPQVQSVAAGICRKLGRKHCPQILLTPAHVAPFVWALWRPAVIILPRDLVAQLDSQQLEMLLAHELSHLQRKDPWVRRAEMLALAIYWWNPIVWWTVYQLREAEEKCCDAVVMEDFPGQARQYGELLLQAAELVYFRFSAPGAAISFGRGKQLKGRVQMIVNHTFSPRLSISSRLLLLLAACIVLPTALRASTPAPGVRSPADEVVADQTGAAAAPRQNQANSQQSPAPVNDVDQWIAEFDSKFRSASTAARQATTREELAAAWRRFPKLEEYADRFFEFVRKNPGDPSAPRALSWAAVHSPRLDQVQTALTILRELHLESDLLHEAFPPARFGVIEARTGMHQELARAALEKNPHRRVKQAACLFLAAALGDDVVMAPRYNNPNQPAARRVSPNSLGADVIARLRGADPDKLKAESEKLYRRAFKEFKDIKTLLAIVSSRVFTELRDTAFQILLDEHGEHQDFIKFMKTQGHRGFSAEKHRMILAKSDNRELLCASCFLLAQRLQREAAIARIVRESTADQLQDYDNPAWAEYLERVGKLNWRAAEADAAGLLTRIVNEFPNVEAEVYNAVARDQTRSVGKYREYAEAELYALRQLAVGNATPDIEGEDFHSKQFRLSDYRGKVVLLDFANSAPERDPARYAFNRDLVQRMEGKPFALIGVMAATRTRAAEYAKSDELTWRTFWDIDDPDAMPRGGGGSSPFHRPHGPIARKWIPTGSAIFLLDDKGVIRGKFVNKGARFPNPQWPRGEKLNELIDQLVEEAAERNGG